MNLFIDENRKFCVTFFKIQTKLPYKNFVVFHPFHPLRASRPTDIVGFIVDIVGFIDDRVGFLSTMSDLLTTESNLLEA